MNVVRLMGGLGNQLFQYSFGRAMKEKGIQVKYDISNFGRSKHREYMLGNFKLNLEFSQFDGASTIVDSKHFPTFDPGYLQMDGKNFFGYWQYVAYIQDILPLLKNEIWVKEETYTDIFLQLRDHICNNLSVGVHVRRDDYVTSSTIPTLPLSYYMEAISRTKGDLYVFSDDIDWCKERFDNRYFSGQVTFVSLPYYLDFELLKLCKSKVISNSTFSWWAAILSENDVVVTPDFWITPLDRMKRNNFPTSWIQFRCDV